MNPRLVLLILVLATLVAAAAWATDAAVAPESAPATAVGTGVLTSTTLPTGTGFPGTDVPLGEGFELAKIAFQFFKEGNWAYGAAVLWMLLLIIFSRFYMTLLKVKVGKTVNRIIHGVAGWGWIAAAGVLGGLPFWPSFLGGFLVAGGMTMVWSWVSDTKWMKKLTGKDKEETANGTGNGAPA